MKTKKIKGNVKKIILLFIVSCLALTVIILLLQGTFVKDNKKEIIVEQENVKEFIGTWRLLSFEVRLSEGGIIYPFGENVKGLLIYTSGGYMSGKLMPTNRTNFISPDPQKGTNFEIKEAFENFVGYYGRFKVDIAKKTVIHHVEGSFFPNWEGDVQKRFFEFNNDLLTLSSPPQPYGDENAKAVLVWKKIE